jgi:hypothetical protein
LATVPPLTSRPLLSAGKPSSSAIQRITWRSTSAGDWSKPARCGFIPEASMSASIASGVPVPMTQPQNRGWMFPLG